MAADITEFKITIVSDGQSCRTGPSELLIPIASKGAEVRVLFKNFGDGEVTVLLPESDAYRERRLNLPVGSAQGVLISANGKLIISYDVYNHKNATYASSERRPIIIVYPDSTE